MNTESAILALWSIILFFEFLSVFARIAGQVEGQDAMGLVLQSQVSLLSRIFAFSFSIILGYAADRGMTPSNFYSAPAISILFLLPVGFFLLWALSIRILSVFRFFILIQSTSRSLSWRHIRQCIKLSKIPKPLVLGPCHATAVPIYSLPWAPTLAFNLSYLVSYLFLYLSWPTAMYLMALRPESRSLISSFPTIFVALNSVMSSVYFDPQLIRSRSIPLYLASVKLRFCASIVQPAVLMSLFYSSS
jgi:hypothetical protein